MESEKDEMEKRKQVSARLTDLNQFLGQQRKRLIGHAFLEPTLPDRVQRKLLYQVVHSETNGDNNDHQNRDHMQAKLLEKIMAEILSILGRKFDSRRLLRRQDLLDLLRLQVCPLLLDSPLYK